VTWLAGRAMQEVEACAAAASAAAAATLAASEGQLIPRAEPPMKAPEPVSTQGWDAAGFGPALVVGSLSTHPPEMAAGGESSATAKWPAVEVEEANYMEASEAHSLSGVDMLWLEMMKDPEHAPRAVKAAATAGLPVFLGISARTDPATGQTVLWGSGENCIPLTVEWFKSLVDLLGICLVGINVMHTNFSTTGSVLKFIREDCGWEGPVGAYPDHGEFKAPEWVFKELDNADAVKHVEEWITKYNVQLVGGCCGLGPDYIRSISAFMRKHNAQMREKFPEKQIQDETTERASKRPRIEQILD